VNHLIVVDADFLSSFLKIERLYLIPQFYQVVQSTGSRRAGVDCSIAACS
jgi:hypothetical protein